MTEYVYDDGGRAAAGYRGQVRDCVVRAIAIATEQPYQTVYNAIYSKMYGWPIPLAGGAVGVSREVYQDYLKSIGWVWTPLMGIGTGCQVHLRSSELPKGRIIARCSRHLVACIDGVIHDNHNPSRGGSCCVYGYFHKPGMFENHPA